MNVVNLVCYNTRDTEVLSALTVALDSLISTSNEIFEGVERRIDEVKSRLDGYRQRFEVINKGIEVLREMENPVIICASEFPVTDTTERRLVLSKQRKPTNPLICASAHNYITPEQYLKTRKVNQIPGPFKFDEASQKSSLLFNMENVKIENMLLRTKTARNYGKRKEDMRDDILNTPLITTEDSQILENDEFQFTQPSESPTEFDLPHVLPGIEIQNVSMFGNDEFSDDDEDIFATSSTHQVSSMPQVASAFDTTESDCNISIPQEEEREQTIPTEATTMEPSNVASQLVSQPVRSLPPPPPPPPSTLLANTPHVSTDSSGRSGLMEAIRAAGGTNKANLKKIIVKNKDDEPSAKQTASQGDDLMGSLVKALEKRRKGISGNTKKKFDALEKRAKGEGPSLFNSMREVIDTKVSHDDSSTSEEEEDWN